VVTAVPAAAHDSHRVRPGETVSEIAAATGTTVSALAAANGLADPDHIVAGQVLVIPARGEAASATVVHVVAPGETLGRIARRYGTSVAALASANGIGDPDLVRIGQRLTIPAGGGATGPATTVHEVRSGETLSAIAHRYGTSVGAIVAANSLADPDVIRPGQRLTIPAAGAGAGGGGVAKSTSAYAATGGADGRTGVSGTHVVARGETLAAIAARYGVSVADLAAANGIVPPNRIYAGARLRLDAGNSLPVDLATCPLPGATFMNDWGFGRSGGRSHEGNDLFAPRGTPVRAPAAGTVSYLTGSIGGHQFRLVAGDGTVYLGSHMDAFGTAGPVAPGDVIGYVGSTGNAAGGPTHLHFEVHPGDGVAMNPYPLLLAAC
jgi:LysM repeat protein